MIISHRYRFIFLKTRKTGGTSVEIALSPFCSADDIITPIAPPDEALRASLGYPGPRNTEIAFRHYSRLDWLRFCACWKNGDASGSSTTQRQRTFVPISVATFGTATSSSASNETRSTRP